jgi:glutamate--cysteine ligase
MGTRIEVSAPPPGQPCAVLRDREQAEGYVALVCFKHGPPSLHGVELEWTVHHDRDPCRPLDASLLRHALGPYAPSTINPDTAFDTAAHTASNTTFDTAFESAARNGSRHAPLRLPAGSLVTVEPGGQVEISTAPTRSAAGLISAATADAASLVDLLEESGLVLGHQGTDPHRPPRRLLQVPRYAAMQAVFDLIGPQGSQMMCSTASLQICLDAGESDQCATRWQAVHALGPTLVALFANSPDQAGRHTGWASSRLRATLGTCPPVTLPPEPSDDPAGQWARLAMGAPVICVRGDGLSWAAPPGLTFAEWVAEPVRVGRPPTFDDLDYHLSTLFPPVRPKGYLEVRYLDAQDGSRWVTPFALLSALMARPSTIDLALDVTAASAGRWFEAARDGLADPVIGAVAPKVVQLGADALEDLDLTPAQRHQVLEDLELRLTTMSTGQRCSA